MNGFALLLATALLGVDYGWQPASDGRLEYIIQLEPITLIALREGQEVVSQIDPFVRDVRRFRIRVGTDVVPRMGTPVQAPAPTFSAAASAPPPGVTYGWQPANEQQVELIVQLTPERLASLKNQPVAGEIPAELKSVARVRVRSGTANLPRQNVPQVGPPLASGGSAGGQNTQGTRPVAPLDLSRNTYGIPPANNPQSSQPPPTSGSGFLATAGNPANTLPNNSAAPGVAGSVPAANNATGVRNTTGGWPSAAVGQSADPGRYNPPSNPPATTPTSDPRTASSWNPDYSRTAAPPATAPPPTGATAPQYPASGWQASASQNSSWQPQNNSWQTGAGQNPSWSSGQPAWPGGQAPPLSPVAPPPSGASAQPGLSDSSGYRPWDGWSAPQGNYAAAQPPASASQNWGTPDDRYTTERGQPPLGYSTAASSGWGQATTPFQPSGGLLSQPSSASFPQPPSWPPSLGGSQSGGQMASPFVASSGPERPSGFSASSPPRPAEAGGLGLSDAVFLGKAPKKKATDFWEDLAASAHDSSFGFLREGSTVSQLADSDKPWWPLTLAMLALFASMGGNLYMGWIAVDVYRHYLEMADDGDDDEPYESSRQREHDESWEDRPRRRERVGVED